MRHYLARAFRKLATALHSAPVLDIAELELWASRLEAAGEFRVLRRLPSSSETTQSLPPRSLERKWGVALDVETTGLDWKRDQIIELAIQRFTYSVDGKIGEIEPVNSWLESPTAELPDIISKLTGLTNTALSGQHFNEQRIEQLIGPVDIIVAHNAGFDRPFVEKRFPRLAGKVWACSLTDVDWLDLGFDGRSLGYLLTQAGWYFDGHRASSDVAALTKLLSHEAKSGQTVLTHVLRASAAILVRITAVGAPFESKDALKSRGYRWNQERRAWWRDLAETDSASELDWLEVHVYRGMGKPQAQPLSPTERFAGTPLPSVNT